MTTDAFKINLNQNLWGLLLSLSALGAADHFRALLVALTYPRHRYDTLNGLYNHLLYDSLLQEKMQIVGGEGCGSEDPRGGHSNANLRDEAA
jgi:hypothetical protein